LGWGFERVEKSSEISEIKLWHINCNLTLLIYAPPNDWAKSFCYDLMPLLVSVTLWCSASVKKF